MDTPDTSILSIGIDIGTFTTSLIISKLNIANMASFFTVPKMSINKKEILYKSQVHKTPFISDLLIDAEEIKRIICAEYDRAAIKIKDVQTGAIIITGESARKDNAENVANTLSGFAGEFVVATAGPDLESIIAGKGSGARDYSDEHSCTIANLDIGGGTTNIAVFRNGDLAECGCIDIGGQGVKFDNNKMITHVAPPVRKLAEAEGIKLNAGMRADAEILIQAARLMADSIAGAFESGKRNDLFKSVKTKGSRDFYNTNKVEGIFLSGGVGECYYRQEKDVLRYNDIGILLSNEIKKSSIARDYPILTPKETIRATVVGAGIHSVMVSGSTVNVSEKWLPVKNIPILVTHPNEEQGCYEGDFHQLSKKIGQFMKQNGDEQIIISFKGRKDMQYSEICNMAESIVRAVEENFKRDMPIMVIVESDIAKSLGQIIVRIVKGRRGVICIDEVKAQEGDYIDMGQPVMGGTVIPVVIKTLLFG